MRTRLWTTLAVFLVAVTACSESITNVPDSGLISGSWTFTVDVTQAFGDCAGEENETPWTAAVQIQEFDDGTVQASSGWASDGGTHVFTGERAGNTVTFEGNYTEDGGLLEALYVLNVEAGAEVMSGIESWTWTRNPLFCPTGLSQVDATRNP